jgi:hypothetical protein
MKQWFKQRRAKIGQLKLLKVSQLFHQTPYGRAQEITA